MNVYHFQRLGPGDVHTFVSASSLTEAYELLSKNQYSDVDVHQLYQFLGDERAGEEGGPRNEDPITAVITCPC